ncbi:MAG: NAD(P)-binding domain-containing protein [Gammaproteobacteria bacterium]|nr:NAD(P)-binding domain-containing protein [Gammaproteobacteria bacterium]
MTTPQTLGFIGVGDLAEYTITGLRRGGYQGRILLSPRNRTMSAKLASDWQCEVMQSNQDVVNNCDYFFLSTRPADCLDALRVLEISSDKHIISVVAGITISQLHEVIGDQINIVRTMPVTCAKAMASPTLVYPSSPAVNQLFDYCGNAIVADDEEAFNQGSVVACVYSWYFALFNELIDACSNQSLSKQMSSELVLGMARGAASLAIQDKGNSPGEIAEAIATEGTFSKLGLDILKQEAAFEPWLKACNELKSRLNK